MPVSKKTGMLLLVAMFAPFATATADQATAYQDATNYASTNQINPAANPNNTNNLPQYNPNPPQASYYGNSSAMQQDGAAQMSTSSTGQWYTNSLTTRPMFTIDPTTDPTILKASNTASNADSIVGTYTGCSQVPNTTTSTSSNTTCQQYRPDQFYTCDKTLNTTANSITRLEYYPSQCISNGVWCTTWSWCSTPSQAMSQGWYWAFKNGSPLGQITTITSCTVNCDYDTINGIGFNRGDTVAFCDLNNCGTIVQGSTSEGIPTYTCTGSVGSSSSVAASCPAGYDMTVQTDGKVICRQSIVSTYSSNPSCSKIGEVPQISLTPGLQVTWEIWACDTWNDACTVYESRAP